VVVGVAGALFAFDRVDPQQFERDVVAVGPDSALLPGSLDFRITEPLDRDRDPTMTVGVALSPTTAGDPDCELRAEDGTSVPLSEPIEGTQFIRPPADDVRMIGQAVLEPGTFTLDCTIVGEPGAGRGGSVRVGRVIGIEDTFGLLGPALVFLAAVVIAGILFLLGVVLLVVGLVRSRRQVVAPGPPPGGGWPPTT